MTPGERLFVWRHREKLTAKRAAEAFRVPRGKYLAWELDEERAPVVELKGLDPHEHYSVLRLRARISEKKMAELLGIDRSHLIRFERGQLSNLKRLTNFWRH